MLRKATLQGVRGSKPRQGGVEALVLFALAGVCGCSSVPHERLDLLPGQICYRGEKRFAQRTADGLVIEGDILVADADQWCDEGSSDDGLGTSREPVRIQGFGYKWPHGIIPYELDAALNPIQQGKIVAAMQHWESKVPGIDFRPAVATDPDRIRYVKSSNGECKSPVGRVGGTQDVKVADWCIGSFSIHHEIGHSLGLYHQHTRKDRDQWVTVLWRNVLGCPATATRFEDCGPDFCATPADCGCTPIDVENGTCYNAHNFRTDSARANIGPYDYDSVMHYERDAFAKGNTDTLMPTNPLALAIIGQRTHLSLGDEYDVSAMYPVLTIPKSTFVTANVPASVCFLLGRREDAATTFAVNTATFYTVGGDTVTYPTDVATTPASIACAARSPFWSKTYSYPNTNSAASGRWTEQFSTVTGNTVLLTSGLLPLL
jgi:hypothetical protein